MKRILFLLLIFTFITPSFILAQKTQPDSPDEIIHHLYDAYRTSDYELAKSISIGKFQLLFDKLVKEALINKGRLLLNIKTFGSQLSDYRVLGTVQKDNASIVSVFWVLKIPSTVPSINYTKVQQVDYLLKKINSNWKLSDARFKTEYSFHSPDELASIKDQIKDF
jgi:hypothetical protein